MAVIILFKQAKLSTQWVNRDYWRYAILLGLPLILHSLSLTLLYQCDKIMIQAIVGAAETGIYSLAVTISGIVTVLVTSIDNAWAPWYYSNLKDKQYAKIRKFNDYMIVGFFYVTLFIMLIAPEIIKLFSTKAYWDSMYAVPPLLVSIFFNFCYLIPVNFEYFHKKTGYIAYSTVITAVINVILNIVFIYNIGYVGAAYATCFSKLALLIMHWRRASVIDDIQLASGYQLAVLIFVLFVCIPLSIKLINYTVLRFAIIALGIFFIGVWVLKNGLFQKIRLF